MRKYYEINKEIKLRIEADIAMFLNSSASRICFS